MGADLARSPKDPMHGSALPRAHRMRELQVGKAPAVEIDRDLDRFRRPRRPAAILDREPGRADLAGGEARRKVVRDTGRAMPGGTYAELRHESPERSAYLARCQAPNVTPPVTSIVVPLIASFSITCL